MLAVSSHPEQRYSASSWCEPCGTSRAFCPSCSIASCSPSLRLIAPSEAGTPAGSSPLCRNQAIKLWKHRSASHVNAGNSVHRVSPWSNRTARFPASSESPHEAHV